MSAVRMEDLPRRHRITVQEYHRMAEVGLLAPDARVELIEGEIIDMAPIGPPHVGTVMMLDQLLHETIGKRAMILARGLGHPRVPVHRDLRCRQRRALQHLRHPRPQRQRHDLAERRRGAPGHGGGPADHLRVFGVHGGRAADLPAGSGAGGRAQSAQADPKWSCPCGRSGPRAARCRPPPGTTPTAPR